MKNKDRKKVLFLITKSNWGGAQRYVFDLATALPKHQFEIVVALGGDGPLKLNLESHSKSKHIRTITLSNLQRDISFLKESKSFFDIYKILRHEKPDILHVNSSKAGGIGAFVGRLQGVRKIIYTAHGWAFNEDRNFISKFVVGFFHWLTILFAHKTICVSQALKEQMKWPFVSHKMTVIHSGRTIPNMLTREDARDEFLTKTDLKDNFDLTPYKNDLWGVTIAELHPVKRHDITIRAIFEVVKKFPNYSHAFIGNDESKDGNEYKKLSTLVQELGLEEHVIFYGNVFEAANLLRAFDLFILSSRSEALGYAVIEAMQAGLPIVATKVGGIPEIIINEKDGLLVQSGNKTALYKAIIRLLDTPELRKKLGAAAEVRGDHFTLEQMVDKTIAVYVN